MISSTSRRFRNMSRTPRYDKRLEFHHLVKFETGSCPGKIVLTYDKLQDNCHCKTLFCKILPRTLNFGGEYYTSNAVRSHHTHTYFISLKASSQQLFSDIRYVCVQQGRTKLFSVTWRYVLFSVSWTAFFDKTCVFICCKTNFANFCVSHFTRLLFQYFGNI